MIFKNYLLKNMRWKMNNIYVETMPSGCVECPCCNRDVDYGACCNLGAYDYKEYYCTTNKHPNCPLKPLSDRLAEERNKVCEKIRKKFPMPKDDISDEITYSLNEFLDQIEKGEK